MTKEERLKIYRNSHNPFHDLLLKIPTIKGESGYTPVRGKDYFTSQEIQSMISFILSQVKDGKDSTVSGPQGERGLQGESIQGERGRDGYTPIYGVDYWTKEDINRIIKDIKKQLTPSKIIVPTVVELLAEFRKSPIHYKDIQGTPNLTDLPKLIEFLKLGGFRGGGGSGIAGGGFTSLFATETPNGVLTVFTFSTATVQPSFILSDNVMMRATTKSGTINWTWNAGLQQATLTIPPSDDILAII